MNDSAESEGDAAAVDRILKVAVDRGDTTLGTVAPILGHLTLNAENSLFSDQIVAQVRGMAADVAKQFLRTGQPDAASLSSMEQDGLADAFLRCDPFITHCHVLAIEGDLAQKLNDRFGIDAVLTPMLQALIASDTEDTQRLAMSVLSAQARFIQHYRRMELPINELPGAVFEALLSVFEAREGPADCAATSEVLRARYNDGHGRLVLLERLLANMGKGAQAALSLPHAGLALFLSALAQCAPIDRTLAVYSTHERQVDRLILSMRASGMKFGAIEEQMALLQPDHPIPPGMEQLRIERARTLLEASSITWNDRS